MDLSGFERAAYDFAESLSDTVQAVAGPDCRRFSVTVTDDPLDAYLSQERRSGIPLTQAGKTILRLEVTIKLSTDGSGEFLRVQTSQFKVFTETGTLPILRYEYERAKESGPFPAAHIQFHGSHPDLEKSMTESGRSTTRSSSAGRGPNVTDLHLPVGGTRFRPCLEDILEVLINEFGIDPLPDRATALLALADGRQEWREKQLRASMRDDPQTAADQLRLLGYNVRWRRKRTEPEVRADHLRRI